MYREVESLCCTAETNITQGYNYTQGKRKNFLKVEAQTFAFDMLVSKIYSFKGEKITLNVNGLNSLMKRQKVST